MKKTVLTVVIAVMALTASVKANAQVNDENVFVLEQIAKELSSDNSYIYTINCQRFLNEAKQIRNSDRLTDAQKQSRLQNLQGIYTDRFCQFLDTQQTEVTLETLVR